MNLGVTSLVPAGDPGLDEVSTATHARLALCLSGGGYRATLFHLGAARRLHELGILGRLDTISSVSGGSLFAAMLARLAIKRGWTDGLEIANFDTDVAAPVRTLTWMDLRTLPFLLHLPWNWAFPGPRARHFERLVAKHISPAHIGDLPQRPEFVFCATDITFGVNWESSRRRTGSYQAGYLRDGFAWPLARAVAASACFPPIFGPLPVRMHHGAFAGGHARGADADRLRGRLALSDGGVYDNMGLEPVWKSHACVLVSDGGAPFESSASANPVRRLLRYTSVVTNQAQALRRRMFFTDISDGRYRGTRWAIRSTVDGEPGYSPKLVADRIGAIRTDLDWFTVGEKCVLENHGYCVAAAAVRLRLPDLAVGDHPATTPPHEQWMDEERVRRALRRSHRRISLTRLASVGGVGGP